jgi:hypothetical protein
MSELEAFTPEPTFNTPEWVEWMQNRCSFVPDFLAVPPKGKNGNAEKQ